ncbi:MAG TPA: cupin domain-containing protein [Caulobacteraceae bacterium]|jgi:hypothetical protein|nr:cupin domain-containing protein [Caulobacteraceae bacterium]
MIRTIDDLLAPHPWQMLRQAALDHRRLHLKTDRAADFAALLPWPILDELVTLDAVMDGRLRASRRGLELPLNMMMEIGRGARRAGWTLSRQKLQALRHQGVSLVYNGVHDAVPGIGALNAMLERRLRCRVGTNAYVSFRRDSAFDIHWDDHNVLILQLHGRKRWFCYGQPYRFPVKLPGFRTPEVGEPEWEGVLAPGDVLYVPRGDLHRAAVEGEESVHLTVGIVPPRGADVMAWLAARASAEEVVRRDLHPFDAAAALAERAEALKAALRQAVDSLDIEAFLADQDQARGAPMPVLNLGQDLDIADAAVLRPALRRRPDLAGDPVNLGGAAMKLGPLERRILQLLLDQDALTFAELVAALDPPHAEGAREAVARLSAQSLVIISAG